MINKENKPKTVIKKILSLQKGLWSLFVVASLALIISPGLISTGVKVEGLKVGSIAPRNIAAPEMIEFEDKEATAGEEERALAGEFKPVYLLDLSVLKESEGKIEESALSSLKKIMERGVVEERGPLEEKSREGKIYIKEKGEVRANQVYTLSEAKRRADKSAREYVRVNLRFSPEESERYRREITRSVSPVMVNIQKGEMIVRRGMKINSSHRKKLEGLANSQKRADMANVFGLILLVSAFVFITAIYLKRYQPKILASMSNLVLLGLIVIMMTGIVKVFVALEEVWPRIFSGYFLPVGAASMAIAILLGARVGILVTLFLSVLIGIITGNNLGFAILAFLGGTTGIYGVNKVRHRADLIRAGLYISGMNIAVIFALGLMSNDPLFQTGGNILRGAGSGFLAAFLTIGGLPFFENIFKITTDSKLLELSDLNASLMKKLLLEAPGTYHHSIVVSNLAESTAEAIGARPLLTRVSGYYHDIGKVKNPSYFIENQFSRNNVHAGLSSNLSNLILNSHVKDGVEIAQGNKLPPVVVDVIREHHGKSSKKYFYYQAQEEREGGAEEDEFRYAGPKPQSREAAIIMLADAAESGTRALSKPTPSRIEERVKTIIDDHFRDGQLDECDLTLKDFNIIAKNFTHVLTGIYHARVEYPEKKPVRPQPVHQAGAGGGHPGENNNKRLAKEGKNKEEVDKSPG